MIKLQLLFFFQKKCTSQSFVEFLESYYLLLLFSLENRVDVLKSSHNLMYLQRLFDIMIVAFFIYLLVIVC